ncbi:MAG: hypothetical protein AABZ46_04460 [Nitrospirota bacterium]
MYIILKILRNILIVIAIIVIVYYVLLILRTKLYRNYMAATKKAMLAVEFTCPEGGHEVIQRWGEAGYMRYCVKNNEKHGRSEAWEGKLRIAGNYQHGKEHGRWTVYNEDGSIYRIIEYDSGKEISNKIISQNP